MEQPKSHDGDHHEAKGSTVTTAIEGVPPMGEGLLQASLAWKYVLDAATAAGLAAAAAALPALQPDAAHWAGELTAVLPCGGQATVNLEGYSTLTVAVENIPRDVAEAASRLIHGRADWFELRTAGPEPRATTSFADAAQSRYETDSDRGSDVLRLEGQHAHFEFQNLEPVQGLRLLRYLGSATTAAQ